jgi:hypothetical protein
LSARTAFAHASALPAATAARMRLITPAPAILNRLHPLARHRY